MAQRVVLVVAFGLALYVAWCWLDVATAAHGAGGQWFNYAPNAGAMFRSSALQNNGPLRFAVQALFIAAWTSVSLLLLRSRREPSTSPGTTSAP